ncbi:hypothetical protein HETIRDRAFT_429889 [Heterobasidion irregulare TC 32-1]|uniref:DUF6533 domain-containing protein n=1 Tax=Heterobasidion irregulare (strain TC 32-1) TaxID=747525 RepID=W4JU73_HETIT|nr:uncharacterized protein HETIRDRAFT_429889 [Heterobasidion irregulare TC 32-1]ETW76421.1 hypothetical protein HETIRDRAFT_429889 [Heterobasidion irregulare TC 32-1]
MPRVLIQTNVNGNITPYSIAGIAALLVYDYICTLDQEIEFVWSGPWSLGKFLFLANRYSPFIDTFISLHLLTSFESPEHCLAQFKVVAWLITLGTLLSEAILMLRTYAIWDRKRWVQVLLLCILLLVFPAAIAVTHIEVASFEYGPSPHPTIPGCTLKKASRIIYIAYVLLMVSETGQSRLLRKSPLADPATVIVALTGIRAIQHLRATRSPLVVALYRDGILFYGYLFAITAMNVIVPVAAPVEFSNWLATPQRVLHSIMCTRVLLFIFRARYAGSHPRSASASASPHAYAAPAGATGSARTDSDAAELTSFAKLTTMFSTVWGPGEGAPDGLGAGTRVGSSSSEEGEGELGSEQWRRRRLRGAGEGDVEEEIEMEVRSERVRGAEEDYERGQGRPSTNAPGGSIETTRALLGRGEEEAQDAIATIGRTRSR